MFCLSNSAKISKRNKLTRQKSLHLLSYIGKKIVFKSLKLRLKLNIFQILGTLNFQPNVNIFHAVLENSA